jgi:hypothetical protein
MPIYRPNPRMRQMWSASDADMPGSGRALEGWAIGEVQRAMESGQLDPNNRGQLDSFLASLGITPEKGGGRFLYNKLTGPGSPLGGIGTSARSRAAAGSSSPWDSSMDDARAAMGGRFGSLALGSFGRAQGGSSSGFDWNSWG